MENFENLNRVIEANRKVSQMTHSFQKFNLFPSYMTDIIESQKKFSQIFKGIDIPVIQFPKIIFEELEKTLKVFRQFEDYYKSNLYRTFEHLRGLTDKIKNNPELQFAFISDLELLNIDSSKEFIESLKKDDTSDLISEKEELLDKNLLPYLEKLNIETIWMGAKYALKCEENPDKLRHTLVSLRTLLEHMIDAELAPKEILLNEDMFRKEFKNYHAGKEKLEFVKIKRAKKIEYFTSKISFGFFEEFTKKDINFICECYSTLCNIHSPDVALSENQVRILMVKTGITLWLLAYINEVIKQ